MTFGRAVILALASSLALVGCQTAKQPDTPSGRAEVEIRAPVASVKAALLSRAMDRRFNVTKDTEYLLQVEKPTENLAAAVLLGSRYDATPSERIVFTFAPMGENTRVVASLMIVTTLVQLLSDLHRSTPEKAWTALRQPLMRSRLLSKRGDHHRDAQPHGRRVQRRGRTVAPSRKHQPALRAFVSNK